MKCSHCGFEFDDSERFCPNCGRKISASGKKTAASGDFFISGGSGSRNRRDADRNKIVVIGIVAAFFAAGVIGAFALRSLALRNNPPAASSEPSDIPAESGDVQDNMQESPSYEIPEGALSYNGHHYYIYEGEAADWDDAMNICESRGGYLAVINDAEENDQLYLYMVKSGYDEAYFGLTDRDEEDEWKYLSGDSSDFRDWGKNSRGESEPNNADGGESYVMLDVNMQDGFWNDAEFGRTVHTPDGEEYKNKDAFFCEWDF